MFAQNHTVNSSIFHFFTTKRTFEDHTIKAFTVCYVSGSFALDSIVLLPSVWNIQTCCSYAHIKRETTIYSVKIIGTKSTTKGEHEKWKPINQSINQLINYVSSQTACRHFNKEVEITVLTRRVKNCTIFHWIVGGGAKEAVHISLVVQVR